MDNCSTERSTSRSLLGIEIDTITGVLRLLAEKLSRFKETIAQWVRKGHAQKGALVTDWVATACKHRHPPWPLISENDDRSEQVHEQAHSPCQDQQSCLVRHPMVVHLPGELERSLAAFNGQK